MKNTLIIPFLLFVFVATAQTKSKTQKKTSNQKTVNQVRSVTTNGDRLTTKERIEMRLNDSAAKNANDHQNVVNEVNGIKVAPALNRNTSTIANKPSNNSIAKGVQETAAQIENSVKNTTASGMPVSNNAVANKPVTNEQSQYITTDINRNQLNVINQNQNASSTQNQATKAWGQNTVGESQWGQNQVGENQWTPPTVAITNSFTRDFPAIKGAVWSVDNNKNYTARYKMGDWWTTSSYNTNGLRIDTRTEIPVNGVVPSAIATYKNKQTLPVDLTRISKVERPGKLALYEVRLSNGSLVYLNEEGVEVAF